MTVSVATPSGSTGALAVQLAETFRRKREPAHRRTHQPVRRNSQAVGGERIATLTPVERSKGLKALELKARQLVAAQPRGTRWGSRNTLSRIALGVWDYLAGLAVNCQGRVFPAYETIAREVGCTIKSAVRAVASLEALGWLEHDRRMEETGEIGQRGPQVKQISNWYRVLIPNAARALLERWTRPRGDEASEAAKAEQEAATARQAAHDRVMETNPDLAETIARLERAYAKKAAQRSERDAP